MILLDEFELGYWRCFRDSIDLGPADRPEGYWLQRLQRNRTQYVFNEALVSDQLRQFFNPEFNELLRRKLDDIIRSGVTPVFRISGEDLHRDPYGYDSGLYQRALEAAYKPSGHIPELDHEQSAIFQGTNNHRNTMKKIKVRTDSILNSQAEAWVNPVNCVGVMGKGLAKLFAAQFAGLEQSFKAICKNPGFNIGDIHIHILPEDSNPRYILNLPTKAHWRDKSSLTNITLGLNELGNVIKQLDLKSIAIPALGCGEGNLDWFDVKILLIKFAEYHQNLDVELYQPNHGMANEDDWPLTSAPTYPTITTTNIPINTLAPEDLQRIFAIPHPNNGGTLA